MIRAALAIVLLIAAFLAGWHESSIRCAAATTRATLAQSEQLRKQEYDNAATTVRALDNRIIAANMEQGRALAARSDLDRLHAALDRMRSAPFPIVNVPTAYPIIADRRAEGVIDLLLEGADLVEEGSKLVEQCRSDRAALIEIQGVH